eukprot:CAMPEP_0174309334 /NCGR_PEP_ID=MMETSP0810-20121108/2341_1 /TAXON_ID=73025 ORGANISM="Eutreptiella gymnastica-like, Strain CCMP1594" /NCGR_SAMPLE_ID=MMETSP0810 /ASSEMBLY_ACC=CAM_ASM_000659 /LENGTH=33 /DNA_ID= /DNA_START= /DNA_END= /DNA_ORIENTATION=
MLQRHCMLLIKHTERLEHGTLIFVTVIKVVLLN